MSNNNELKGVAPSILSADFGRLSEQVGQVMDAGARVIHVDVMDGHFVPPITMGPIVVDALASDIHQRGGIVSVHLMIEQPERQVAEFARAGADVITAHVESTPHIHYVLKAIREAGCASGIAICPGTPVSAVAEVLPDVDAVLCMSVDPGWGGQKFLPHSVNKVQRLRELIGPALPLGVDGGIDTNTAKLCASAGATKFVAGSAIFGASDPAEAYREIVDAIDDA